MYQLADYLDQHGRRTRTDQVPPTGFWDAVAAHAHPDQKHPPLHERLASARASSNQLSGRPSQVTSRM